MTTPAKIDRFYKNFNSNTDRNCNLGTVDSDMHQIQLDALIKEAHKYHDTRGDYNKLIEDFDNMSIRLSL